MGTTVEIEASVDPEGAPEREVRLHVWPRARRVLLAMPVTLDALAMDGPVVRLVMQVCGTDAIAVGDIGARLDGMAFCAKRGAASWRTELGLAEPAGGEP